MIALDTNVLLRILLNDDPKQSRQAQAIVARATSLGEEILLPDVVLCEDGCYRRPSACRECA